MLYHLVIPLLLTVVPWLLVRYLFTTPKSRAMTYAQAAPYLWGAAAVWTAAVWLPRFWIGTETDTFGMHFLGGVSAA